MASVMMASGRSRPAAFWSAVVLACATLAGVLVIHWYQVGCLLDCRFQQESRCTWPPPILYLK